ncbi:MarR family transcriptional regulator [Oceanobacillus kimchii]|uniref:MarR family winged helix-turn-helix transcriptional regulator n=1 Tax=Oceanobacillus TaxID=182709 RepID=UPI00084E7F11|nr:MULTISPECIES: MarR family transcriptional regulator [Oceanobacillus]MCT1577266.1 MarR family transcriptional regulator [Oceanobacillus kimchii]MCT2135336.1 MarR family transcriptional regulator [Oceanobacillus kimchii]OEH56599.1 transcriptional regulator [Oceanobacillus sp. E9]
MNDEEKITKIIHSFREVNRFFYKQMWHHANDLGITVVQLQTMKYISEQPNISLQQLAEKMNINKSTVSSTVDRLVKASFIKREQSTSDRRAINLNLTEEGKKKEAEGKKLFHARLHKLSEVSDEDTESLFRLHQLIKEKLAVERSDQHEG